MIVSRLDAVRVLRLFFALCVAATVAACSTAGDEAPPVPEISWVTGYGPIEDDGYSLPGIPSEFLEGVNRREIVLYNGDADVGDIEIDPHAKFLFFVLEGGYAVRYPIAVGREGKGLRGATTIRRKEEWPGWTPSANMLRSEPEVYGPFAGGIPGGLRSPLGARALYLYRGGNDTRYRIHGTNDLGSIGNSGSAGCIRLFNQDIIDLYERVEMGAKVTIRSYEDSVRLEGEELANRGIELPAKVLDPEDVYGDEAVAADHPPEIDDEATSG